jgi:hypothetical protein
MYDHGYQEARGYKQILRLYERSMINCLKTGMGATSLIRNGTVGEEEEETKMMEDEELCPCGCQQIMKKGQFLEGVSGYVKDVAKNGLSALQFLPREEEEKDMDED